MGRLGLSGAGVGAAQSMPLNLPTWVVLAKLATLIGHFLPFLLRCAVFSFASALSAGSSSASKTKY